MGGEERGEVGRGRVGEGREGEGRGRKRRGCLTPQLKFDKSSPVGILWG